MVVKQDLECALTLLEAGGDPNTQDNKGWTALHWAIFRGEVELIEPLLRRGANPTIINCMGNTPLHIACRYRTLQCCDKLLNWNVAQLPTFLDIPNFKEETAEDTLCDPEMMDLLRKARTKMEQHLLQQMSAPAVNPPTRRL